MDAVMPTLSQLAAESPKSHNNPQQAPHNTSHNWGSHFNQTFSSSSSSFVRVRASVVGVTGRGEPMHERGFLNDSNMDFSIYFLNFFSDPHPTESEPETLRKFLKMCCRPSVGGPFVLNA